MVEVQAKVTFKNIISKESKLINKNNQKNSRDIYLDLFDYGISSWTRFIDKYNFKDVNDGIAPLMMHKSCIITAEEFIDLVGNNFEEAQEKISHIASMIESRKEHPTSYTQIFTIQRFYKEMNINEIEKVTLSIIELW